MEETNSSFKARQVTPPSPPMLPEYLGTERERQKQTREETETNRET